MFSTQLNLRLWRCHLRLLRTSMTRRMPAITLDDSSKRNFFTTQNTCKKAKNLKPSLLEKYMKVKHKDSITKVYEVWLGVNAVELAKILRLETDEVIEIILMIDPDYPYNEFHPINDRMLLQEVKQKLRCKFKYIPNPNLIKSMPDEENLDAIHPPPKLEDLKPRPPVCAIVGHIDHGKTTLLDYLRKSSIVSLEFGGITQHIGAFSVALPSPDGKSHQNVTFLDTPGHAAFKNMRIRGASITDIVILVVDAVEGPLEQTLESIQAVRSARVNLIVAINKIDKPNADIEKTKKALFDAGVNLEDFGGDVQSVAISALKGTNVNLLIEAILAQAEVLQLAGDYSGPVEGTVVESSIDPGLGRVATVLISRGTLKKGSYLVSGYSYAKVRMLLTTNATLEDEKSNRFELKKVCPSEACKIVGWKELPNAGSNVKEVENEVRAKQVIEWRKKQDAIEKALDEASKIHRRREDDRRKYTELRIKKLSTGRWNPRYGTYDFWQREKESEEDDGRPRVSIVIKADVDGSLEAIAGCFSTYDDPDVDLDIIHMGVGDVTETDLKNAKDFDGIVYLFNSSITDKMRQSASFYNVPIREFNVIYALMDDLKSEINQKIPPEDYEITVGRGFVQKEFLINERNKKVPVAGCKVTFGKFDKLQRFRVLRGGKIVHDGEPYSLRNHKEETQQIARGQECGLRLQDTSVRFEEQDEILCYEMAKRAKTTTWFPGF